MRNHYLLTYLAIFLLCASTTHAQVTLTFDADTEGFVSNDATATWSNYNGGSLCLTAAGGWAGNGAQLDINNNAALWAELQAAVANGGTISYDVFIEPNDVTLTAPPNWFETVQIANSGGVGGWDQEVVSLGLGSGDWPLTSTFSTTVTSQILFGAPAADGDLQYDPSDGWAGLILGLNNEAPNVENATVYFDNVTITAVPEPSTCVLLLGMAAGLACVARRRRR